MAKFTDLGGKAVFIIAVENIYLVRSPFAHEYPDPGEFPDHSAPKAVIVPISGPIVAVKETPIEVARILGRD